MTSLTPGDRISQVLDFFGGPLTREGVVLHVDDRGRSTVQFGPDRYSKVPYTACLLPGDRRVEVIEPTAQPTLFGGGA